MANVSQAKGFRPEREAKQATPYKAAGTIYPGDMVTMNNTGQVVVWSSGVKCLGVAATYATSGNEVMVWDSPAQRFIVQSDAGTTLAQTDIGLNYDIVATAGSSTYKQSRQELDSSTGATDSTLPLRLLGQSREVNTDLGEYQKCVVEINNHQLAKPSVGL